MTTNEENNTVTNTTEEAPKTTTKKSGVAIWEYRNTDEDFDRLIVVSMENLQKQLDEGTLDKEDIPKILYGMEGAMTLITNTYNLYPKSSEFDNKKPSDFNKLGDDNSSSE